jgi:TonB-linked SusC/RagA family outer membrane protein
MNYSLKMRYIFFFVILGAIQTFAANTYSQSVFLSIEKDNATIKEILSTIEKESEFYFTYNSDQIDVDKKTSVKMENKNIKDILDMVFAEDGVKYTINDRHIVLYKENAALKTTAAPALPSAAQQERTITGVVTDENGDPLVGAIVMVEGTNIAATTDIDGKYSISQVPDGATLVFSYIGYIKQEIKIGNGNNYPVRLQEDIRILDEVVVVGYGTQKRETLTGAIASINSNELMTTKTDNLLTNMAGKMPGLLIRQQTGEPGDFSNLISIRGFGPPVVVIDGVIRNRDGMADLAQLTAEDIQNISILKDGSAAIYGMNAANGVILVTTKKGEVGKARISYQGMYSLKMPTSAPEMMSAYDFRVFDNEFSRNGQEAPRWSDEQLEGWRLGKPGYPDTDWVDLYMRDVVPAQRHTLSVRGGSDHTRYFTSLGYTEDNGLLTSDVTYYKRYNLRSNLTVDLTKDLSMNVMISGRIDKRQNESEAFIWTYKSLIVNDRGVAPYTLNNPDHLSYVAPEGKNPAALISPDLEGYNKTENLSLTSQIDFTYQVPFVKGLNLKVLGAYDVRDRNYSELRRQHQLFDYMEDTSAGTRENNRYTNQISLYQRLYGMLQANYEKKIGDHSLTLMAAMEASERRDDNVLGQRLYDDLFTFDILDMASSTGQTTSGGREFQRNAAYLGRVNYDYQGKYLLEAVARYDGSYRYAPSKRWVFFPSVSVGWRVSEEKFMKSISFINNLKLRASYGESGRDQGSAFSYVPAYTMEARRGYMFDNGVLTAGMYPPGVVNDLMSWVTAKMTNFGIDADILNNKFGFTFEYFERKNTGILANRVSSVPNTFGASFPQENINSDMNHGLELALKYRGNVGKDFKFVTSANVTYTRTKRIHVERGPFTSQWDRWINGNENRYTGRNLIYTYDGQYTSLDQYETAPLLGGNRGNSRMLPGSFQLLDNNGDGRINGDDQLFENWAFGSGGYVSGESNDFNQRVNPPLQYGFTFDATYKSFDLSLLFQGAALYSVNLRNNDIWGYGRYPTLHSKFADRWHTQNSVDGNGQVIYDDPFDPNTIWIPGKYPPGRHHSNEIANSTDTYVISVWRPLGNYLRLKNIELGYTVPKDILKKAGIGNIRIFTNITNLLLFCNEELKNSDPERHENDWDAGLSYPIMKAVNFGLSLNF